MTVLAANLFEGKRSHTYTHVCCSLIKVTFPSLKKSTELQILQKKFINNDISLVAWQTVS